MTKPGRGPNASPASNDGKHKDKKTNKKVESDVSYDEDENNEISLLKAQLQALKKLHKEEVKTLRTEFNAKFEVINNQLQIKDDMIGKLRDEIGILNTEVKDLKETCGFLTNETSELKTAVDKTDKSIKQGLTDLTDKTVDLEDRSRRNNLVFFGFPENNNKDTQEDCDQLLTKILQDKNIIGDLNDGSVFDRAHRLGPRRNDQERPRPIIVRVTFFKDKQHILKNANKFKGSQFSVAEDYSKPTLAIRRQLLSAAKSVIDKCGHMKSFKITYKRLVVK